MGGRILRPSLYRTIKVVMSDGSTFHVPSAVRLVSNTLQLERDTANHPAYQVCMQTCLRRHTSILHALQSTKIDVYAEGGVVSLRAQHHLCHVFPCRFASYVIEGTTPVHESLPEGTQNSQFPGTQKGGNKEPAPTDADRTSPWPNPG